MDKWPTAARLHTVAAAGHLPTTTDGAPCSYTTASHAVMNGVPVPVVSRLLGHANVQMTLRYAHLADRDIEAAAERTGQAMAAIMSGELPA